jgi:DNA-directed RNA polymerase specialized sigma24 family protein
LLQEIARKKILQHVEYHCAAKRDVSREEKPVDWEELPNTPALEASAPLLGDALETVASGLTPPDSCLLRLHVHGYQVAEVVQLVLRNLPSPYPEILQLRLQGFTEWQIAQKLGCCRETVHIRLARIVQRLGSLLVEDSRRNVP